ncbi:hypothetical protein BDV24DRAFT_173266 [Aspergillus arachidicola]|uniref:Rhodopsin domain-containing protein n=1 Tax=Aspergillus arachidicola TaxID=656916 RepID=A0A5N6YR94_9EURO|nr:hypothetical protein BDV24DRAFT_173266 [Aspergillus arachidicola]
METVTTLGVSDYWRNVLIVVPIICGTLATAIFLLRLYYRRVESTAFKIEDLLMGLGLFFSYGITACTTFSESSNGASWVFDQLWPFAQVFVKVSIIIFLQRLFSVIQLFRILARSLIVFTIAWGISAYVGATLQCLPPRYFWDTNIKGRCMPGQTAFYTVHGSLAFIEDVVILCMPIPIVWRLHSTLRQKFEATFIFSIGILICVFSILRFIGFLSYITLNRASLSDKESLWANLELYFGITCGCLLLCKPLLRSIKIFLGFMSRSTQPEYSSD